VKYSSSRGFTLIELTVTLILLGILTATIAPRFLAVDERANLARFESVRGSFKEAIRLARAQALIAQAQTGAFPATILAGGLTVDMNTASGWPNRSQPEANCAPLAFLSPGGPRISEPPAARLIAALLGISAAQALGGGGGGGGGDPCTLLELIVAGDDFDDWTQSFAPDVVTYTDPLGNAFTFNHETGEVL